MSGKKLKGKLQAVDINYGVASTPPTVKELKALLYKEGGTYFVWSGASLRNVHYGFGDTAQAAMDDFQQNYCRRASVKKEQPEPAAQTDAPVTAPAASLKERLFAHMPYFSERSAIAFIERLLKKKGDPI